MIRAIQIKHSKSEKFVTSYAGKKDEIKICAGTPF